jgi:hypothetical protein
LINSYVNKHKALIHAALNQKIFIILNVAMGGNLGGTVDPSFTTDQMEIDYVGVYQ